MVRPTAGGTWGISRPSFLLPDGLLAAPVVASWLGTRQQRASAS
jgi:hypothetical protein